MLHLRWLIRLDTDAVLGIDSASYRASMDEEELRRRLRQRYTIGMVAEAGDDILGFMLYDLHSDWIELQRFAVHPSWRRHGVGREMMAKIIDRKLMFPDGRRNRLCINVGDDNLIGHLFLRSCGFRAEVITGSDYRFTFAVRREVPNGEAVVR